MPCSRSPTCHPNGGRARPPAGDARANAEIPIFLGLRAVRGERSAHRRRFAGECASSACPSTAPGPTDDRLLRRADRPLASAAALIAVLLLFGALTFVAGLVVGGGDGIGGAAPTGTPAPSAAVPSEAATPQPQPTPVLETISCAEPSEAFAVLCETYAQIKGRLRRRDQRRGPRRRRGAGHDRVRAGGSRTPATCRPTSTARRSTTCRASSVASAPRSGSRTWRTPTISPAARS